TFPGPRPVRPGRHLAVVACMDSRLDLFAALGLHVGDAHVIRNAGGIATDDVLRSLAISQRLLGTRQIVLVHHTECGMLGFDDEAFRAELRAESGQQPSWNVPGFTDVTVDLRSSMARVRDCPWLPHRDAVRGFVFDVTTGHLNEVR
ncbi:MAG TPA: carbonic anhydrase, partial [Jatrophihabitantaceae bacterium]